MSDAIRTPVIAGNWKMHKGPEATREFCSTVAEFLTGDSEGSLIIFPPSISLTAAARTLDESSPRPPLRLGVQNIYWKPEGAFTGEISAPMAKEAGAEFVLVGHSERRHIFGETNDDTRLKLAAALESGLRPVLCVGETLDQRKAGEVQRVITEQLDAAFDGLDSEPAASCLIAYEPVWAIGTGVTATPDDAADAHGILRARLRELIGTRLADGVPILYGGSVKPENAADLGAADNVDGLLVGGASLDPRSFAAIAAAVAKAHR